MKWFAALLLLTATMVYPPAFRGTASSTFFSTIVPDPYRWMENADSSQTRAWAATENFYTRRYLDALPLRDPLHRRLVDLWHYSAVGEIPQRYGELVVRHVRLHGQSRSGLEGRVNARANALILLDPAERVDGAPIIFDSATFSPDGHFLAFATQPSSSHHYVWRIRNTRTRNVSSDAIAANASSTIAWSRKANGFFYVTVKTIDAKHVENTVRYHRLRDASPLDRRVFSLRDLTGSSMTPVVSTDNASLVIITSTYGEATTRVFYRPIGSVWRGTQELFSGRLAGYQFIDSVAGELLFESDYHCPDTCLIAVRPQRGTPILSIAGEIGESLQTAIVIADRIFVLYCVAGHSSIDEVSPTGGRLRELQLPAIGTVDPASLRDDGTGHALLAKFTSYIQAPTLLRSTINNGARSIIATTKVPYDPRRFVTEQRFCLSRDGARIPMFVTHLRSLKRNMRNPTILYVYGGFGISQQPVWTPEIVTWLSIGGVYAVVNARGGSEYGEAWHLAGSGLKKQNTIDDTIAAALSLAKNGYTNPSHLAIRGDSNGGFVAAAAVLQRPTLFQALIAREGVFDLIRYDVLLHGTFWDAEYGSKTTTASAFERVLKLSPLREVRSGTAYPAVLIQTGDADDVVSPAHAFKFVATLQADQSGRNPVLLRVDHGVGHHGGEALAKVIDESVDQYSFLLKVMGVTSLAR